jgi:putative NADH-flavin reductase
MKVLVLGATGRTGRCLVARALAEGHELTLLVRNPKGWGDRESGARLVTGSATDAKVMREAVAEHDAVLCALGPTSAKALIRCDLMRAAMDALIPAMEQAGVDRLVLLSALGVGESAGLSPRVIRLGFRTFLRQVGRDKSSAEDRVRNSELQWTIVYPPRLTTGPATDTYRAGERVETKGLPKISRADVAAFMVGQLGDRAYLRKSVIVTS